MNPTREKALFALAMDKPAAPRAAYRAGQSESAVALLEPAPGDGGSHRVTIPAHYVLALAQFKAGGVGAVEQQLVRAERFLNEIIAAGVTGSSGPQSEFAAMAIVLRDEVTRVMNLPSPLPVISKATLAPKRAGAIHRWDLRAIRTRLKTMNLDWDWPEFSAPPPVETSFSKTHSHCASRPLARDRPRRHRRPSRMRPSPTHERNHPHPLCDRALLPHRRRGETKGRRKSMTSRSEND